MKKKIVAIILGIMSLGLVACGNAQNQNETPGAVEVQDEITDVPAQPTEQPTEKPEEVVDNDPQITPEITDEPGTDEVEYAPDSIEGQIYTISQNSDLWYEGSGEGYHKIKYAVTDLDMNGRLEIIMSDFNEDSYFSRNRFYEVTEDYSGLYKMEYDCETKWANGEEDGYAPDLMLFSNMACYSSATWGSATDDYAGPTYFYITEDELVYPDYESSVMAYMELIIGNQGTVHTFGKGMIYYYPDGTVLYNDEGGLDCTEEEFFTSLHWGFNAEYGWAKDNVTWSFVDIDVPEHCYNALVESYQGYTRENLYPADIVEE